MNELKLEVGQVIKNLRELCELLGVEYQTGINKAPYVRELSRYGEYYKKGNRFIIDKVYKTPKPSTTRKEVKGHINDQDLDDLYRYVKDEILQYKDKKMPNDMMGRLIGLKEGKFYANNNNGSEGTYDYKLILLTFKLMKGTILSYIDNTEFKNERHKINGIMKIIESEINNVKDRLNAAKKSEEKTINVDISNQLNEQSTYKRKSKNKNDSLKDLW